MSFSATSCAGFSTKEFGVQHAIINGRAANDVAVAGFRMRRLDAESDETAGRGNRQSAPNRLEQRPWIRHMMIAWKHQQDGIFRNGKGRERDRRRRPASARLEDQRGLSRDTGNFVRLPGGTDDDWRIGTARDRRPARASARASCPSRRSGAGAWDVFRWKSAINAYPRHLPTRPAELLLPCASHILHRPCVQRRQFFGSFQVETKLYFFETD